MTGGSGTGNGTAPTVDTYFMPRETPWFRPRLAVRLAVPLDRSARVGAARVAWSALLTAPPLTTALVAPLPTLTLGAVLGLFCSAVPGLAALTWSASHLRDTRRRTAQGLRQAGAEQHAAGLVAAGRLALFAGFGALVGALFLTALHEPLLALLPRRSPLRPMYAATFFAWTAAVVMTAVFAACGALLASAQFWARVDWSRFDVARYARPALQSTVPAVSTAVRALTELGRSTTLRARRGSRRPR
jgi:hypothetical protein